MFEGWAKSRSGVEDAKCWKEYFVQEAIFKAFLRLFLTEKIFINLKGSIFGHIFAVKFLVFRKNGLVKFFLRLQKILSLYVLEKPTPFCSYFRSFIQYAFYFWRDCLHPKKAINKF